MKNTTKITKQTFQISYQCQKCQFQCYCFKNILSQLLSKEIIRNQIVQCPKTNKCLKEIIYDFQTQLNFQFVFSEHMDNIQIPQTQHSTKFFFQSNGKQKSTNVECVFCFKFFTPTRINDHILTHRLFNVEKIKKQNVKSYLMMMQCPICKQKMETWKWPLHVTQFHQYADMLFSLVQRKENDVQMPTWYKKARQLTVRIKTKKSENSEKRDQHLKQMRTQRKIRKLTKKMQKIVLSDPSNQQQDDRQDEEIEDKSTTQNTLQKTVYEQYKQKYVHKVLNQDRTSITFIKLTPTADFQKKRTFDTVLFANRKEVPAQQKLLVAKKAFFNYHFMRRSFGGVISKRQENYIYSRLSAQWQRLSQQTKLDWFERSTDRQIFEQAQVEYTYDQIVIRNKIKQLFPTIFKTISSSDERIQRERKRQAKIKQQIMFKKRERLQEKERRHKLRLLKRRKNYAAKAQRQKDKYKIDCDIVSARLGLLIKKKLQQQKENAQ